MVDVKLLIDKYYKDSPELREILWTHSKNVADHCVRIARQHPELNVDLEFLEEAALLHDIGVVFTDAPGICCFGSAAYICHGYLGAELLRKEGMPKHARVCERHTGTGLSAHDIIHSNLEIPVQDYYPETIEEQIICYADKFYSKTRPNREKTIDEVLKSLECFGNEGVERFRRWMEIFE